MPERGLPLRDRALALLARREHSRVELAQKLEQAGFPTEEIAPVLDEFEARNWLSDRRFSESYVADHRSRYGAIKLAHELRQRGVKEEVIKAVLEESHDGEMERARAIWNRKFGSPPAGAAEKARQMRFMQSRGFAPETVRRVISGGDVYEPGNS